MIEYQIAFPTLFADFQTGNFFKQIGSTDEDRGVKFTSNYEYARLTGRVTYELFNTQSFYFGFEQSPESFLLPFSLSELPKPLLEEFKKARAHSKERFTKDELTSQKEVEIMLLNKCVCKDDSCLGNHGDEQCGKLKTTDGVSCSNCGPHSWCKDCYDITIKYDHADHTCDDECCGRGHSAPFIREEEIVPQLVSEYKDNNWFESGWETVVLRKPTENEKEEIREEVLKEYKLESGDVQTLNYSEYQRALLRR